MKKVQPQSAVMVTGSSGYIGKCLLPVLSARGMNIVAMYYHRLPEASTNVFPVCSDMSSPELLAAPLRGVETVIHLAWRGTFESTETKKKGTGAGLSPNLIHISNLIAAMEKAGTKRLIFASAIGAGRGANELFLREKYLAESLILNSKIPEKLILRLSIVCGRDNMGDRFLRSIQRVMRFPGFYPVPMAQSRIAPAAVSDVTKFLADLAAPRRNEPRAALFEVEGGERFQVKDLFRLVNERIAKKQGIGIQGFLGDTLLPLFEHERHETNSVPRLRRFLTIGRELTQAEKIEQVRLEAVPMLHGTKRLSFKDLFIEHRVN